jgi:hypothetical protein
MSYLGLFAIFTIAILPQGYIKICIFDLLLVKLPRLRRFPSLEVIAIKNSMLDGDNDLSRAQVSQYKWCKISI